MQLAIVFAKRAWLAISLWKTGKGKKKEKEHTRKKKDSGSRAQPPRSGDCD
jgi:hypothetical protein